MVLTNSSFFGLGIAVNFKAHARLDTAQHAHQPFTDTVLSDNFPRCLFLAHSAGGQILNRPLLLHGYFQRCVLDLLADLPNVPTKILQQNLFLPQVAHHSRNMTDLPQTAPQHQPVQSAQHSLDPCREFFDKLIHGVSLYRWRFVFQGKHLTVLGNALFWLRLCRAKFQGLGFCLWFSKPCCQLPSRMRKCSIAIFQGGRSWQPRPPICVSKPEIQSPRPSEARRVSLPSTW